MRIRYDGKEGARNVPIEDHLTLLILPLLPSAAYIDGRSYASGIDVIGTETIVFGKGPVQLMTTPGVESISVTMTYSFVDFMRMIGKIGYGLAVASYGLSAIAEPYVLPAVLGRKDEIGKWAGSDDFVTAAERQGALHACTTAIVEWNGERLIVVKVKLFADAHPTGYHVIVGRAT